MHDTLRFWLDRGADGFRMDVVHCIGKDPALPDMPAERERIPACALIHDERTHAHLREIRRLIDAYSDDRVMVGEVAVPWIERMATYYGDGDELHLSFNFPHIWAPWEAAAWRRCIDQTTDALAPRAAWPTWVLSNHDNPRHRTRYGSESRARAAAVALLGLRGTPFLYAGEELGLTDAEVPEQRVVDPGGRDGCRAPIPWDDTPERGWGPDPWLPWPPADDAASAAAQRDDPGSTLHLYRALLAARRGSAALRLGDMEWLETPDDVLAWTRRYDGDVRAIAVNFGAAESEVEIPGHWRVEATSDRRGEGGAFDGRLGSEQAALLTPDTP
jgi:alpha-glucosidase